MKAKEVILYDIYTNRAEKFSSMGKLGKYLGIPNTGNLTTIAGGKDKARYLTVRVRYTIFYADDFSLSLVQDRLNKISKLGTRITPIIAFDLLTKKTYEFKSFRECADKLHIDRRGIGRVIHGKKDEYKGYRFSYKYAISIPKYIEEIDIRVYKQR